MSIIYNGKTVANKYNLTPLTPSSEKNAGAIKIATEDELLSGSNDTAVTPYLLNKALSKSAFCELGDIGIAPLGIDESLNLRRYLNGQTISQEQFEGFTTWLKLRVELYPTLSCTNSEYETICNLSTYNQCGKFVIDNKNKTIRLPKIVNIQGLQELNNNIGNTISAGLPDISFYGSRASNTFGYTNGQTLTTEGVVSASSQNPIYGNSDTVQPEAIQYPYYIQVATGVKENIDITRDLELNNPYSLGESKYSEIGLNNASWLKSEGQYNSKTLYPSMYEWVLKNYNKTVVVDGVSVRLNTESYTDYDYVLNLNDETFRLPLLDGSEDLQSDRYVDLTLNTSGSTYTAPANGRFVFYFEKFSGDTAQCWFQLYGSNNNIVSIDYPSTSNWVHAGNGINVKKDDTVTLAYGGSYTTAYFRFIYAQGNGSLYYYIGDTIQDANIINAGSVINDVNNLKRNTLNTSQITNCITEIPQNIKLELKDGVLTLKAGSKVYVPNGFEADGVTPKFDEVVIDTDFNVSCGGTGLMALGGYYDTTKNKIASFWANQLMSNCLSGATITGSGNFYGYDTSTNTVNFYRSGVKSEQYSFILAIINVQAGVPTSIDQTFNGFGYIGSTVYALPNVKGLIPNGRNEDGSLRNIEFTVSKVLINNKQSDWTQTQIQLIRQDSLDGLADYDCYYNQQRNLVIRKETNIEMNACIWGIADLANGVISNFQSKLPFRAVDEAEVSNYAFPSNKSIDLTLGASGSTYTAPANGYFSVSGIKSGAGQVLFARADLDFIQTSRYVPDGAGFCHLSPPAKKNDVYLVAHDGSITNGKLRFIYAEGEV